IVVIMVLLLLVGVAVPSFFRFQHAAQFQSVVRRSLGMVGEARGLAVSTEHEAVILYDGASNALRLMVEPAETDQEVDPNGPRPPADERAVRDIRVIPLPPDVFVRVGSGESTEEPILRFYPDGRAEPGTLQFQQEGSAPVLLTVNPRTGRARLQGMQP
ncbi:MAG: hypothetical protein ACO1SX_26540, partial [Actinomycetota bacterium]